MHETKIVYLSIGGGGTVRRCQGCSVFGMEKYGDPPSTVRAHGYAAGRIEFGENDGTLRLWPRIATSKTGRWRFIPDHENAELHDDEATKPETFAVRTITVLGPVSRKQRDHGSDFIKIPRSSWPDELAKKDMPDSMLLRPESRVVRFHRLREPLRDTIVNWAITPDSPVKLRLQAGEGGAGKTRLLIEVCHQLEQSHGWRAGFVERSQSSASGMSELLKEGKPSLIVLDYAESRTSEIVEITKVALRTPNAPPARLVLLAREGGDWWDRLADGAGSDQAVSAILRGHVSKTGPYRMTGERIKRYARGTIFAEALHDFAVSKGVAPPSISPPDLSDDLFGNPLFIHLSALSHLRGQPSIDDKELLGMALGHERSYWWQLLSENGLLALQPVLEQAVALFTLCGGKRTAKEARAVLSRRVVDILRTKLPGTTLNLVNLSIEIRRQAVAFLEKKKMGSPTKRPRSMVLLGLCALRRAGTGCEPAPSCRHGLPASRTQGCDAALTIPGTGFSPIHAPRHDQPKITESAVGPGRSPAGEAVLSEHGMDVPAVREALTEIVPQRLQGAQGRDRRDLGALDPRAEPKRPAPARSAALASSSAKPLSGPINKVMEGSGVSSESRALSSDEEQLQTRTTPDSHSSIVATGTSRGTRVRPDCSQAAGTILAQCPVLRATLATLGRKAHRGAPSRARGNPCVDRE